MMNNTTGNAPPRDTAHGESRDAFRLLTVEQVAEMLGIKPRTVWRMLSRKTFPEPRRFGGNTRWEEHRIRDWIAQGCPVQNGCTSSTPGSSNNGVCLQTNTGSRQEG